MRLFVSLLALTFSLVACASPTTDVTSTSSVVTSTSQVDATTTAPTTAPTTTIPATTTTKPSALLPNDACDQLDPSAIQDVLQVDSVRLGSPSGTSSDGLRAGCRFAVTYNGNFGSGFNVTMRAPVEGVYDELVSGLSLGDGVEIPGLGNRALMFTTQSGSTLVVVEFANLSAAYAVADSDAIYSGPPEEALAQILTDVIGSLLLSLP